MLESLESEFARAPREMYKAMRDGSPVMRVEDVGVLVTTRPEVEHVLQHPELFSSAVDAADLKNERPLIPLQIDPPDHLKFRKLLNPLFSPQRMQVLEGSIAAVVHELIDGFAGATEIDFAKQFSIPFPSKVFLTMFGLPYEDLPQFLAMKDGIIRPNVATGKPFDDPETHAHQAATAASIYAYFEPMLEERARAPRDDLLSFFLEAEVDGERLSRTDILDICFLFLIAGLDTVSASLDCFFSYLVEHPDRRDELVADPSIVPAAVEELLRWETPVMAVPRIATADTEVGGCPIAAGEHVMAFLGSANTDADAQPGADVADWHRQENRHVAFGAGIHRCLGSNLARLELVTALTIWHERIPEYRLAPGAELVFSRGVRSVDTFPMLLGSPG